MTTDLLTPPPLAVLVERIIEIAAVDSIVDAIKKKQVIVIYYDGDEPGGRGLRIIEPVCYGYSKTKFGKGNPVLRAWDMEGASHRGYLGEKPLPGWRLFRIDKILSFKPTGEVFTTPQMLPLLPQIQVLLL